jgi:hypothetical protein
MYYAKSVFTDPCLGIRDNNSVTFESDFNLRKDSIFNWFVRRIKTVISRGSSFTEGRPQVPFCLLHWTPI